MERTKIIIMAPAGRMDRLIVKAAAAEPALQIVGGVGTPGRSYIGKDIALAAGLPETLLQRNLERWKAQQLQAADVPPQKQEQSQ